MKEPWTECGLQARSGIPSRRDGGHLGLGRPRPAGSRGSEPGRWTVIIAMAASPASSSPGAAAGAGCAKPEVRQRADGRQMGGDCPTRAERARAEDADSSPAHRPPPRRDAGAVRSGPVHGARGRGIRPRGVSRAVAAREVGVARESAFNPSGRVPRRYGIECRHGSLQVWDAAAENGRPTYGRLSPQPSTQMEHSIRDSAWSRCPEPAWSADIGTTSDCEWPCERCRATLRGMRLPWQ